MAIVSVGIDLAKNVFAVHGVDEAGKPSLVRPNVPRARLLELIATLPPCLIGMEACSGAYHWAREFAKFGHTVRLMAPKFVIPYRLSGKRGKNDAADAAAICEAVTRPNMRFVPVKSIEQQGQLLVHRARQGFVEQRTATLNRIRGLLSDLVIVLPLKAAVVRREALARLEDLPGWANTVIGDLLGEVARLDERISQYDQPIRSMARQSTEAQRLMQLSGIGETTATALLSTIGKGATSGAVASYAPGSVWCPGSTARTASSAWGVSPKPATRTCAACWCWAPGWYWRQPRTPACAGRCSANARTSGCRPEVLALPERRRQRV